MSVFTTVLTQILATQRTRRRSVSLTGNSMKPSKQIPRYVRSLQFFPHTHILTVHPDQVGGLTSG